MTFRLVTDHALAQRLERAEAQANAAFVEARAARRPASGATWREIAGTWVMFDGPGSPLSQGFGAGLFADARSEDLAAIEDFFDSRGTDTALEICPLADPALLTLLPERGYRPVEWSTVLLQPVHDRVGRPAAAPAAGAPTVRRVGPDEHEAWASAAAAGWGETPALGEFMLDFGHVSAAARGMATFVAELDGTIIATGGLAIHGDVALLAGASTRPAWRGRGAQNALLAARLDHAAAAGCTIAMMAAAPGSTSQCNAERQGFRIAWTRTKWVRPAAGGA